MKEGYKMTISNKQDLKKYYMSFVENGGIFIPTKDSQALNAKISLQLNLPETPEPYQVEGHVVWINPEFAQQGREQGIGVQFNPAQNSFLNNKIEALLVDVSSEDNQSATL